MFSLLLVTAMSAVADNPKYTPAPTARPASRAYFPAANHSDTYYQPMNYYSYSPPATGFGSYGGYGCYCPTDDVNLFLPCAPPTVCPPLPVRPVAGPRVNVFPCPAPARPCCPRGTAPCP